MLNYINKGTAPNNGTGTPARLAAEIINANFDYLLGLINAANSNFPIITIASRPYELRKTVNLTDPAKTTTLETGDIVFGTPAAGVYVFAKRLAGGDANDINDTDAFEIFGGI